MKNYKRCTQICCNYFHFRSLAKAKANINRDKGKISAVLYKLKPKTERVWVYMYRDIFIDVWVS